MRATILIALSVSFPLVATAQDRWRCTTVADAEDRKQSVVKNVFPRVVFEGETKAAEMASRIAEHRTPALSVAVIHKGKLDWSAAWGRLNADGAAAACDTLFQAGSIAKPVTLFAAFRMKQQGVVDFDKGVDGYLKTYTLPVGLQTADNPITLRNLFAHTSGLTPGGYTGYTQQQALPTDQQIVRGEPPANSARVEVVAKPGARLAYSGGAYTVIEIALQDKLGKPFEAIMQEWLTAPVGMKQATFAQPLAPAAQARTARGHKVDGTGVAGGWHHHPEQAAAGLWATASDLAAFMIELHKGYRGESRIFTQASIQEFMAKPIDGHAYGFRLIGSGEDIFITHYGGTVGYRAGMTMNLRTGDGAAYLSNSDSIAAGVEFLNAVSRAYRWPVFKEVTVKRAHQSAETLASLAGSYDFNDGPTVVVAVENSALTLIFPNGDRYAMVPIQGKPREFIHPETAVRASFDGEGKDTTILLYGDTAKRRP
jgi:CubicO group peptidase (beta-lactamase class C family)